MPDTASLDALISTALDHHRAGDVAAAENLYRQVLSRAPENLNALHLLGALVNDRGCPQDALLLLEQAAAIAVHEGETSRHGALYNNLGNVCSALGRSADAVAHYQHSLTLAPENPEVHANLAGEFLTQGNAGDAILHFEAATRQDPRADWTHKLGQALAAAGRGADAEAAWRAALAADPAYAPAVRDLGQLLCSHQRGAEAIPLLTPHTKANPNDPEGQRLLGMAFRGTGKVAQAITCFSAYCRLTPTSATGRLYLGTALSEAGRIEKAIESLEIAVSLAPDSAIALIELGNAYLRAVKPVEAQDCFLRATAIQQVITRKAAAPKPAFAALMVLCPGVANIPYDYLIGRAGYDAHFLWYLPQGDYDLARLRACCDLVVNLISDADQAEGILPAAGAFIDLLGKPVINHPSRVMRTDRSHIAQLLVNIPGCRVARVLRVPGSSIMENTTGDFGLAFPFLARVAGLHGGEAFEMITTVDELRTFAARDPRAMFYLMDYMDFRSPDGYFRKYRFFCIGGDIYPYHLAIGDHWKVHHYSTDMANQPWMQQEEAAFLDRPETAFTTAQCDVLRNVAQAIGLEYMGVDCAIDREGEVVVFEANAAMLLHGNNAAFPYKDPHVRRIKSAFDAMLQARASG